VTLSSGCSIEESTAGGTLGTTSRNSDLPPGGIGGWGSEKTRSRTSLHVGAVLGLEEILRGREQPRNAIGGCDDLSLRAHLELQSHPLRAPAQVFDRSPHEEDRVPAQIGIQPALGDAGGQALADGSRARKAERREEGRERIVQVDPASVAVGHENQEGQDHHRSPCQRAEDLGRERSLGLILLVLEGGLRRGSPLALDGGLGLSLSLDDRLGSRWACWRSVEQLAGRLGARWRLLAGLRNHGRIERQAGQRIEVGVGPTGDIAVGQAKGRGIGSVRGEACKGIRRRMDRAGTAQWIKGPSKGSEASGGGLGGMLVGLRGGLLAGPLVGAGAAAGQASSPSRSDIGVEPGGADEADSELVLDAVAGEASTNSPGIRSLLGIGAGPERNPAKGSSRFAAASDGAGTGAIPVARTGMENRSSSEPTEPTALAGSGVFDRGEGAGPAAESSPLRTTNTVPHLVQRTLTPFSVTLSSPILNRV
jgi:hypothetical protein